MDPGNTKNFKRKQNYQGICEKKLKDSLAISKENTGLCKNSRDSMILELKIQILNDWSDSKSHLTKADLARKYNRNESTIRNIIKSENAIRKAFSEVALKRKNCAQSKCLEID